MKAQPDLERLFACSDRDSLPEAPPNYPPMAAWPELRGTGKILAAWRRSLRSDGGRRPVVYVHVPFCETICRFCGFYKLPAAPGAVDRFLDALEREVELVGPAFRGRPLRFLCLGGGTPSLLSVTQLDRLFRILRRRFAIVPETRIAFEASPGTLDPEKLAFMKSAGVEWLAIGVQSFDPALMKSLNRRQDPEQAVRAVREAKRAGIKQVEIDLMTGLPGQTGESFLRDVRTAAGLDVERIYLFDFQPRCNTSAGEQRASLAGRRLEDARGWRRRGMDILLNRGYKMRCGHWVYKRRGDWWPYSYDQGEEGSYSILGLGPSAVSYAMNAARYRNLCDEAGYEKALAGGELPSGSGCLLSERDEMVNFVLLDALHRGQVDKRNFRQRFGRGLQEVFGGELAGAKKAGILADSGNQLLVTDRERVTGELRRALFSAEVLERLAGVYGPGDAQAPAAAPAAAPEQEAAFFGPAGGVFEYSLQRDALGFLLYGRPAGEARQARSAALALTRGAAGRKALLISAGVPGEAELAAARYAAKAGSAGISLFCRLPPGSMPARLAAAGVEELLFPFGAAVSAAELKAARAAAAEGLKLRGVHVLSGARPSSPVPAMKKLRAAGAAGFIVSFPGGKEKFQASYAALAAPARAAARSGAVFLRAPLCVIYPDWERSLDRLERGYGDARESGGDAGAVKPRRCLLCRYLLKCPGPAAGYAEKHGFKGLKAIK